LDSGTKSACVEEEEEGEMDGKQAQNESIGGL